MMRLWMGFQMARGYLKSKLRDESGISEMTIALILIGIAITVAVAFREQLGAFIGDVFKKATDEVVNVP